jgi:hypothetical protein
MQIVGIEVEAVGPVAVRPPRARAAGRRTSLLLQDRQHVGLDVELLANVT